MDNNDANPDFMAINEITINGGTEATTTASSSQPGDTELTDLVDRVYTKILDMAKDKTLTGGGASTYTWHSAELDKYLSQSEVSMDEENRRAYPPHNILINNNIVYTILKHTCLNCSKSFEQAKALRRHFILEHIVHKPTYRCDTCSSGADDMEHVYELDKYLVHVLSAHDSTSNLEYVYDLFILKYTQDVFCDYFMSGHFYLEAQQVKHINKLKFGKEGGTLISKMHSKIFENYFINDESILNRQLAPEQLPQTDYATYESAEITCRPPIMLTSKSIKSNLLYSQITKSKVLKEIYDYMRIERNQMSLESLNLYALIEESERVCAANTQSASNGTSGGSGSSTTLSSSQLNAALMKIWPENFKYNQCKFCMKIFRECNAYKEHVMEVHTFNEFCNRCLVCPYCKQLLKSNFDKNCDANVLLNIHIKKCIALKSDLTHVFNSFINTNANSLKLLASVNNMHRATDNGDEESETEENEAEAEPDDENEYENEDEFEVAQHVYMKSAKLPLATSNDNKNEAIKNAANLYSQMYENGTSIRFENTTCAVPLNGSSRKGKGKLSTENVKGSQAKKLKTEGGCYLCDFKNGNRATIERHLMDEHVMVKCSICEQDLLAKSLRAHLSETHIAESTETCFECPFEAKVSEECRQHLDLTEFMQHVCIASKLAAFRATKACPICGETIAISDAEMSINNLTQVERHFQGKHAKIVYNCELCTASFREENSLIEHVQCEHRPLNADTALKQLKCFRCGQLVNYLNESNLIEHVSNECVRSGEDIITNSSIFLNPLSILSNVSTTIPHMVSVVTGESERLSALSSFCADDAMKVEKEEEIVTSEVIIETVPLNHEEEVLESESLSFAKLPIVSVAEASRDAV